MVRSIVATARSEATRRRVIELGIADQVVETNAEAAKDADLVIVCIPVGASGPVTAEIAASLKPGAILSDVGSVKTAVLKDMAPHVPAGVHLIPAHPVAGTENSGPDSGFPELFVNRWCILTPPQGADADAVEKLRAFWTALGANVEIMTAEHHDMVLAITSHLPHLIAYTIVGTAEEFSTVSRSEVLKFSAGGFRDFTRIAASDPTMWRDVFLHNKEAVLEMLAQFNEDLSRLTRAMRRGDGEFLFDHFTRTRAIRRGIVQIGQDSAARRLRPHASGQAAWRRSRGPTRRTTSRRGQRRHGMSLRACTARATALPAIEADAAGIGAHDCRRDSKRSRQAPMPALRNESASAPLPEIPQHFPRRIVPRQSGHAAARMRPRSAHVEARQRPAVVRMAEHRAGREHLPEIERTVKNVAADEAEGALEIERRHDLPPEHRTLEVRRMAVDRRDHQVGDRLAMVVPRSIRQFRRDVLAEQARDMLPRPARACRRASTRSPSRRSARFDQPCVRASK